MKRPSQKIKKTILSALAESKALTYSELERKINTGYRTIVSNCKELQTFNAVKITKTEKHTANGRPFFTIKITEQGKEFLKNLT